MAKVIIHFDTREAAQNFVRFIDNQGEQTYWDYMDCQDENDRIHTVGKFHTYYHYVDADLIEIKTTLKKVE